MVSSPVAVEAAVRQVVGNDRSSGQLAADEYRGEVHVTNSIGKIFVVLFIVAVVASNVTGEIAPLVILAAVAFTLLCVHQELRR